MRLLFRQFSTPGGVPSHAGPNVPGSINEGGDLARRLHAYGAPRNFCMLRRARRYQGRARELIKMTKAALDAHRKYIVENLEDMPAIRNWKWTPD